MKEYKTKDDILEHAPQLTEDDLQELNKCYVPYMFYNDDKKNGVQHCTCTSCRESFDVPYVDRLVTPERIEFLQAGHNQTVRCPKCGRTVQKKQKGRSKKCNNLWEYQRAVFVKPVSKNEIYLIYVWSEKFYHRYDSVLGETFDYSTLPRYEVNAVYYITPNQQRCFIDYGYSCGLDEHNIREPFFKSWMYLCFSYKRGYVTFGIDKLEKTFLKYYDIVGFLNEYNAKTKGWDCSVPFCKYLCYFAKYPSMEWLLKQGYFQFVYDAVEGRSWRKRQLDWSAKGPYEFFKKLGKPEIKAFAQTNKYPAILEEYAQLKQMRPKTDFEYYLRFKAVSNGYFEQMLSFAKKHKINLTHLLNYLEKQKKRIKRDNPSLLLIDYIDMAKFCGYDLKSPEVLLPKALKKAHDTALELKFRILEERRLEAQRKRLEKEQAERKEAEDKYGQRYKKLKKLYEFDNGMYKVTVPENCQSIINEGATLHHCVGGYALRHCQGKTTILFIRLCKEEDKPLLTVEIDDKTLNIRQVHGLRNRNPDKVEQAFINMWMAYVVKPNTKTKKNKKAAEAA